MLRTELFPDWLGWLGIIVAGSYLVGLIGRLWWKPLTVMQGVAFFLFLAFVLLTGLRLLGLR